RLPSPRQPALNAFFEHGNVVWRVQPPSGDHQHAAMARDFRARNKTLEQVLSFRSVLPMQIELRLNRKFSGTQFAQNFGVEAGRVPLDELGGIGEFERPVDQY